MRRPASRSRRAAAIGALVLLALACHCDLAVNLSNLEGGCPPGLVMVKITTGSSPFCIDATEATNTAYAQFLTSGFTMAQAAIPGGVCAQVPITLLPGAGWPAPSGEENFPVTNVNWCQAYAFCKWEGKRLCGQIGGGALASANYDLPSQSQWLNACSKGGALTYPYGNTFDENACGGQAADSTIQSVTFSAACVGPVAGLYDLSGSVWEWTDACGGPNPTVGQAFCDAMGGAFDSTEEELECVGLRLWDRNAGAANIGIRCCLDL